MEKEKSYIPPLEDLLDLSKDFFRTNIGQGTERGTYVVLTGVYDAKASYKVLQIMANGQTVNPPKDLVDMNVASTAIGRFKADPCRKDFIKYFRDNYC